MENEEKNKIEGGTLYLVATPIGNLADISARALKGLEGVDFVAAEDTRNSGRLLHGYSISKPLFAYHEHNKREAGEEIVRRLLAGESCALVTDAGTPAISDPGEDLVRLCVEREIPVCSVPGACALISALILSGLPTGRFVFEGFLPVSGKERKERLAALAEEEKTVILHEAPHKLRTTLEELAGLLGGERRIALCRELTKLNEEILRMTLAGAVEYYRDKAPRGEYVLVIEGARENAAQKGGEEALVAAQKKVAYDMSQGVSRSEAVKRAAKEYGVPKNLLYNRTLEG